MIEPQSPAPVDNYLAMLADMADERAVLNRRLQLVNEREALIRQALQNEMYNGHARSVSACGVTATLRREKVIDITSKDDLLMDCAKAGVLDECTRLDLAVAKKMGAKLGFASVTTRTRDTLVVSIAKEDQDANG